MAKKKSVVSTENPEQKPAIGLTDLQRDSIVGLLHVHLSNLHVLYIKTRNYHWNVRGRDFSELHALFEAQYTQMEAAIDEYAERVRQVGGLTMGTMREFLECATLKEEPGIFPDARTMAANLLADHEAVIRALREDVDVSAEKFGDLGTSDLLTGKMQEHEKMAWMLRAYLGE